MKVILGRYMDGGAWPDAITAFSGGKKAVGGVNLCGPAGFLSLMKEKLGLPVPDIHGSCRIAAWQSFLEKRLSVSTEEKGLFYAESFRADSWNTAKRLLQMRDELKSAGALEGDAAALNAYAEECTARDLPRLAECFRLEELHRKNPVPGQADLLRLVLDELRFLAEGTEPSFPPAAALSLVELATPERHWQKPWQEMFGLLRLCGTRVEELPSPALALPEPPTAEAISILPVFAKGGHVDLSAANLPEAAEALAAALRARFDEGSHGRTVILRAENSMELDGALERHGLPDTGCRNRSTARPFVQLLPLYLRLQLLPFDPENLRQFLLLPVSPLDAALRRNVLHALQHNEFAPWSDGFASWPKRWQEAFSEEEKTPLGQKQAAEWICPSRRVPVGSSIRCGDIVASAKKLELWAEKQARPPLPRTAELCRRLIAAVQSLSSDLSPLTFEKLLDAVLGEGENGAEQRPAAPWAVINNPGQLWGQVDTLIWWDFTDDGSALRDSSFWSDEEHLWLESRACPPADVALDRRARTFAMTAPFFFARRVITITPRFHGSEESLPHPLRALMPEERATRIRASSALLGRGEEEHPFFTPAGREKLSPPPPPSPWNEHKGRRLEAPKNISPSVLESLLACPAAWYFREVLGLDAEHTALSPEAVACGNLAHEIMEGLLREMPGTEDQRTPEELRGHILVRIAERVQDRAARLALPEYEVLRGNMADRLKRSFLTFRARLKKEGLIFLDSERTYRAELGGTTCTGRYDLMLGRKGSDVPCVVADMKWSRRKVYKEQIEEGRAVQLAAYGYLLAHGRRVLPGKNDEKGLAPPAPVRLENAWFFLLPEARIHASETPLEEHWQRVASEWDTLCADLEAGRLRLIRKEASAAQEEPSGGKTSDSENICTWCAYKRLCGRTSAKKDAMEEPA
ncbi:PD-(D/E)XK nuclease family protein [Mailhella massiliensis]|uniref:PD-(D/E)XK nuclease family protein n=1 Tax=Mailhella massiliensis TaxID=1903261 RepID=A0A921AWY3_9BACT|nr:PD-(D/E)XK nuclease family protein [Mailhella massiliensis]HJD97379.1 PD-(D/E)XK nuclease family protein [Mailhella massiliensis]